MNPFYLTQKPNDGLPVPCGKCPDCLKARVSQWSFRLLQENRKASSGYFITLTYDNNNISRERGTLTSNGFMSLSKRDVQLFWKRLRKVHSGLEGQSLESYNSSGRCIKYYVVGEYGGATKRPHYHAIVFNIELELMIGKKNMRVIDMMGYDSKRQLDDLVWKHGKISVGTVGEDSVGYALKYMTKRPFVGMHERDDRQKEFACMSKGLGDCYLTDEMKQWHLSDVFNRMHCCIEDGKKIRMPRYYKNKIYGEDLRSHVGSVVRQRMVDEEFQVLSMLSDEERELINKNYREGVEFAYGKMYRDSDKNRIVNF